MSEWTADWIAPYSSSALIDPKGPATGSNRTLRGGYYSVDGPWLNSSSRDVCAPDFTNRTIGVRVSLQQVEDGISIYYPKPGVLYESDSNRLSINWSYQSQSNGMQSLSWAYKLDEDFYGTGTSATQVDGNDSVDGSSWLSGLTADGGSHTLYVALLDQGSNVLATDSHGFTYQSGSSGTQSGGGGHKVLVVDTKPRAVDTRVRMEYRFTIQM